MKDIAVVMTTVDRSPRKNYIESTLASLERAGVSASPRLHSFAVVEDAQRSGPTLNAAVALDLGAQSGAKWVLLLEDDIDVCGDFLGSVGRWLDRHAGEPALYAFGGAYPQLAEVSAAGGDAWEVPLGAFVGLCAVALRARDAGSLAEFWRSHAQDYKHDRLVRKWVPLRHPGVDHHLASVPSFVQHLGAQSSIYPDRAHEITFPTWPGREWVYR